MEHPKPGDTIGIFSPSSYVETEKIQKSLEVLESAGFKPLVHEQTYARHNQSAGTHEEKLQALYELYENPEVKAVWAAGGGNRALHLLDKIDYDRIKANPKTIIGFSDTTALLNAFYKKAGINGLHAAVLTKLADHKHEKETLEVLQGNDASLPLESGTVIKPGKVEGKMIGGNLSVFMHVVPLLYKPEDFKGHIVFLEDCNEELSHLDRKFLFLKQMGVFENCEGLILGGFSNLKDSGRPYGFTLEDIIKEHTQVMSRPVVINTPIGHADYLFPIRFGAFHSFDTATI